MNFKIYLEKQGYTEATIKKTLPIQKMIDKEFPDGVPNDEYYVQEKIYGDTSFTNRTKSSCRGVIRRYLEYLDYLKRNEITC